MLIGRNNSGMTITKVETQQWLLAREKASILAKSD